MKYIHVALILITMELVLGFSIMKAFHYCVFEDYSIGHCYTDIPEPWDAGLHNIISFLP